MKRKMLAGFLSIVMACCVFTGCGKLDNKSKSDNSENVVINVVGPWDDFKALDDLGIDFSKKYPNCTIQYEYLQNYNEMLLKRLSGGDSSIDIFICSAIQADSELMPYAVNLYDEDIDLSQTHDGLIKNFELKKSETPILYSIPIGGELRGMYVNKTLLNSVGLKVPTNKKELLSACETLKGKGYIPLQGNPGNFGVILMYPEICNIIANNENYSEVYEKVNSCEEGISELFEEPMNFLYTIMSNKYYYYKYVETELGLYTDMSNEMVSKNFLNIAADGDSFTKVDDLGQVAFMPGTMSLGTVIDKTKEDYHSEIEYEFILSPVADDGGFAYMSPARGIAISNISENRDWAVKFLNYMFDAKNNTKFAKENNIIPNTKNAFDFISDEFDIPDNHISQLGQVTFDYDFYSLIEASVIETSKGNNPKYMKEDGTLYDFTHYMDSMENRFTEQRTGSGDKS